MLPRTRCLALATALVTGAPAASAQDAAASLGKQRAASSSIEWEIREAGHPVLGNIRFAFVKRAIETRVGNSTVYSRAYLSCQKDKRSFAIELANAVAPADPGGLKPATDPRLYCHRPENGKVLREEILASWEVNPKIGDALTRGLRAFPLRECAAITVQQEVVLPEGWAQKTARIEYDILPYNRELDAVFATCGERSAYGPSPPPVVAAANPTGAPVAPAKPAPAKPQPPAPAASAPPPRPAPAVAATTPPAPSPAAAPPTQPAAAQPAAAANGWREARTLPTGKTNVRAGPTLQSAVVVELHPGSVVMVQGTGTEWWRARPSRGNAFEGYIRQDRLVIK